jgi:hypothetical protein
MTGRCLCGKVRYEVSEPFADSHFCHCTRCQHRSGTAFSVSGRAVPGSFAVTEGEELIHSFDPGGGGWIKAWCSNCGGHLYSHHPDDPTQVGVRMGTLDGDPGIRPSYHQFTDYAPVWLPIAEDGLPRFPERRPA